MLQIVVVRLGPWRTRPGPIFEAPNATLNERFYKSKYNTAAIGL
jgi:hypothetical protein